MKLEAMNRQGQRTDLDETLRPVGAKLRDARSDEQLANTAPDSARQIQRYIRLTYLTHPLLDMVDEGKIAMRPAVELSYLSEKEQTTLQEMMELEDCTPSHAQAIKMRRFAEEGKLSEDVILSIMQEEKPNQKEQFRMPRERISKYFPAGTPAQKIEDTIIKALELYQRQRNRDRER
jgi:ParB family chromosome partitioning protein